MNPAAKLHQATDTLVAMAEAQGKLDHCCKGCTLAHCCMEAAYADSNEVAYALETPGLDKEALKPRIRAWLDKVVPSGLLKEDMPDAIAWRKLNAPCPLLVDNRCSVYERRPFSCRMFYAHGKPENCAMPARISQKFAGFPIELHAQIAGPYFGSLKRFAMDNVGVLLAELVLNEKHTSGSRQEIEVV